MVVYTHTDKKKIKKNKINKMISKRNLDSFVFGKKNYMNVHSASAHTHTHKIHEHFAVA